MKLLKPWKSFYGAAIKLPAVQWMVALVMSVGIWFVYLTSFRRTTNWGQMLQFRNKAAIFVFWHGRSMMLSPMTRLGRLHAYAIASRSRDGRKMAKLQRLFGMRSIYGSAHDGGVSVLRQAVRILRRGDTIVCLAPDGPDGPSLRIQDGALYMAQMSGAPILPVCFSTSRPWIQKRWDRYMIALPFSRVHCHVGEPFYVPQKLSRAEFDATRKKLEEMMIKQMRDLDAEFNVPPVEQDLVAEHSRKRKAKK